MVIKIIVVLLLANSCLAVPMKIIRPCDLKDYKCIRDNLSANSKCNTNVKGAIAAKYMMDEFRYETPYFNSSYIDKNLIVRNQEKCSVSEFFFNMESDVFVLGIDCPQLDLESQRTLIQHYSLDEDAYFSYHIRGIYPLIRFTLNIRKTEGMDVCSAFVFTEVAALPKFHIDPNDKPTANMLTKDLTLLNIYEIETFAYRGTSLAKNYINTVLCDFECKI